MNPLRVQAQNYRTFERLDVELPSGTVAIVGPNGAGKSSILNLVDVALFAGRGELPPLLTSGEEELALELTFEHANELYRVRRQYSARGRGKTVLDFEQLQSYTDVIGPEGGPTVEQWVPLTRVTAEQTQQLICETLGLSRTTFRASSFLAQGDGAAFTEAQPRDRKAILAEILVLDLWERLLDRARVELRGCEDELVKAGALISGCEETIASKSHVVDALALFRSRLDSARKTLAEGETEYELAVTDLSAAQTLAEKIRACEAELAAAMEKHVRASEDFSTATKAAHTLADKQIELEELQADASRVDELATALDGLRSDAALAQSAHAARATLTAEADQRQLARDRMVEQAQQLYRDSATLTEKSQHLLAHIGESASCDRCGQTLGREAAERAAHSYSDEAAQLAAKAAEVTVAGDAELQTLAELRNQAEQIVVPVVEDPAHTERQLAAARRAAEQAAVIAEQIRNLAERAEHALANELRVRETAAIALEKQDALDAAKETVVDLAAARARAERSKIAVAEARGLIENRQRDVAVTGAELAGIERAEVQLEEHRAGIAETRARVDVLKLAERAYGRDGIPALIVENAAIPQLELEANRILGELGGSTAGCRIELRTQRALKSAADVLRETLDIVIVTPTGERVYETFSGGERTRLNLALRIALARLLAHRRGAESRLLAIDEPDGLDADGMDRLSQVLYGMSGTFDRILVVSHNTLLSTAFDQTLVVSKDGDRSRLGDPGLEAIAA